MKITAQEEYGLRCLLQLARHQGPEPLTVSTIAGKEGLSIPYAGKLMAGLRQSGLIVSQRGRGGGFVLSRPAGEITVAQALGALGGQLFEPEFCNTHHGAHDECVHIDLCSIRNLWGVLGRIVDRVLSQTTLLDLIDTQHPCEALEISENELARLMSAHGRSAPAAVHIPLRAQGDCTG